MSQGVRVNVDARGVATITMDRPEVRNAFDDQLIVALTETVGGLAADDAVRVVVLTGAGEVFSAGADLNWMRSMKDYSYDDNVADAARLDAMLRAFHDLPKALVARVNGHALGGGTGLVSTCDIVVAVEEATFGFTEVVLGLAPAVISPYVVRKVGRSFARATFVTGERFGAARAYQAGLVHQVVHPDELDEAVEQVIDRCLRAGPEAVAVAKRLPDLVLRPLDDAAEDTTRTIAQVRIGDEAQAGMQAFFDKRPAPWVPAEAGA